MSATAGAGAAAPAAGAAGDEGDAAVRSLALICDPWPAACVDRPGSTPVAVMHADRCVSVNAAAQSEGVGVGLRRREVQARCPSIVLSQRDEVEEGRRFEAVLGELERIVDRVEVGEPGVVVFPTRGPSRLNGGDRRLAESVRTSVLAAVAATFGEPGRCGVGVGIADGPATATIAAQEAVISAVPVVVPVGTSGEFLSRLPVERLAAVRCADPREVEEQLAVLRRLGLRTVGRFAGLAPADVQARFGATGIRLHRLARGREELGPITSVPPVDLRVAAAVDPPAERVEQIAFRAKGLAEALHSELAGRGLACTSVTVVATTDAGDRIERQWRHNGALDAAAIAQRMRWQLEGWLSTGRSQQRCSGGVDHLELVPLQVAADTGLQQGFWGGASEAGERAVRALARVQGLMGSDAVRLPEHAGGRSPGEQYRLVGLDAVDLSARRTPDGAPWPGALPAPSPTRVWWRPQAIEVLDAQDRRVRVNGRGIISAAPCRARPLGAGDDAPWWEIRAWAGPWCVDERWWDPIAHRRRARLQVVTGDASAGPSAGPSPGHPSSTSAHLLTLEDGSWWLEATYD